MMIRQPKLNDRNITVSAYEMEEENLMLLNEVIGNTILTPAEEQIMIWCKRQVLSSIFWHLISSIFWQSKTSIFYLSYTVSLCFDVTQNSFSEEAGPTAMLPLPDILSIVPLGSIAPKRSF